MLTLNPSEVIWTILSFFALYFLLKRFLYTPLTRFMDERQARIDAGLQEERDARAALEEQQQELERQREESIDSAKALLSEQKQRDTERRAETIRQARQAAADAQTRAREQAAALREQTAAELDRRREELAACLAAHLLEAGNLPQETGRRAEL